MKGDQLAIDTPMSGARALWRNYETHSTNDLEKKGVEVSKQKEKSKMQSLH